MSPQNLLRQVKVSTRLWLLALLSLVAVLLSSSLGLWASSRLTALSADVFTTKDLVADILPPPMYLIELRLVVSKTLEGTLSPKEAQADLTRLTQEYQTRERFWKEHPVAGLDPQLLDQQFASAHRFLEATATMIRKAETGQREELQQELAPLHALYLAHRASVDKTVSVANQLAGQTINDFSAVIVSSRTLLWTTLCIASMATAALSLLVIRSILAPLAQSIAAIRQVASGNLTGRMQIEGRDELSQLQQALQQMQVALTDVVQSVRDNAESVATASREIAQGNQDLCQRTELQASTLQQTAATMDELGGTVSSNAEHARDARVLVVGANEAAEHGGAAIEQVVHTMTGISDSSKRIGDIIGVIDGIAFQTNILALNAAVEAARAGEQGRGFAVVAGEVRVLAQRSAQAAKEIKQLIAASAERVQDGCQRVDEARKTMLRIVETIQQVNATVTQISAASAEQSTGVTQVGQAINQLDHNTQRNAALVEESTAAAESLSQQSQQLVQIVAKFSL